MTDTTLHPDWLSWPETQKLAAAFTEKPDMLRFVGGAVRDALLGLPGKDVDLATICPPDKTMELLKDAGIKAIPTGIDHGTVTAVIGSRHFEITTLRKDTACDGRHAMVQYTDNWMEDAQRRDFTMNAMYLTYQGVLHDYFGGEADAKAGIVRFIGDAKERISEDRLRILRFFRFYARYGKTDPDAQALAACSDAASQISELSGERIQKEMLALMDAPQAVQTIRLMHQHGVLEYTLGFKLHDVDGFERLARVQALAALPLPAHVKFCLFVRSADAHQSDAQDALIADLRLSNVMADDLVAIGEYAADITPVLDEAAQKRFIRMLGKPVFSYSVMLNWAISADEISVNHPYYEMLRLVAVWKVPEFPVSGSDLIDAGKEPGKELGALLRKLETAWEASNYALSKEELLQKAAQ